MKLFECIDGLIIGAKYLTWMIGVAGILLSVILFVANLALGFSSAAVFIASFFLAIGVTLLLMPKSLTADKPEGSKKNKAGAVCCVLAAVIMGLIYLANGGFPELNLLVI